jgi:hypothetical protein
VKRWARRAPGTTTGSTVRRHVEVEEGIDHCLQSFNSLVLALVWDLGPNDAAEMPVNDIRIGLVLKERSLKRFSWNSMSSFFRSSPLNSRESTAHTIPAAQGMRIQSRRAYGAPRRPVDGGDVSGIACPSPGRLARRVKRPLMCAVLRLLGWPARRCASAPGVAGRPSPAPYVGLTETKNAPYVRLTET